MSIQVTILSGITTVGCLYKVGATIEHQGESFLAIWWWGLSILATIFKGGFMLDKEDWFDYLVGIIFYVGFIATIIVTAVLVIKG